MSENCAINDLKVFAECRRSSASISHGGPKKPAAVFAFDTPWITPPDQRRNHQRRPTMTEQSFDRAAVILSAISFLNLEIKRWAKPADPVIQDAIRFRYTRDFAILPDTLAIFDQFRALCVTQLETRRALLKKELESL
jgi:hypothetical protein